MSYRAIKSRITDEVDDILIPIIGMGVYDMADFRWGDYRDAEEALMDALDWWLDYGDISQDVYDIVMDALD